MHRLLRAFSTMLKGTQKTTPGSIVPTTVSAAHGEAAGEFAELSAKLSAASQLLIVPTPGSVCQVGLVLEDVQGRMARLGQEAGRQHPDQIRTLQGELGRIRTLVEGALRVQWTQMRAVMALTQSYSPGGRITHWQPPLPKVDLKV
jgi:hypothetical protein